MHRVAVMTLITVPLCLLIGISAFLSDSTHAAEYHVSKQGSDVNPGTQAEPFETICLVISAGTSKTSVDHSPRSSRELNLPTASI